jgi:two-component sensor histidine kinase
MSAVVAIDIISTAAFGLAIVFAAGLSKEAVGNASRYFLFLFLGIYFFVGLSNIFEHSGTTSLLDRYEDYVEILFIPFFLFFEYSLHTKLEMDRRTRGEERIRKSLKEKEALLREVHHRVKNNLQVISSMLKLQARHAGGKEPDDLFIEGQNRVKTMALIHENLYRSQEMASVSFRGFINDMARGLFRAYVVDPERISFVPEVQDMRLNMDTAVPVGLIVNELLSNSIIHAFPGGGQGEIRVSLRTLESGEFELSVSDNGAGMPPGFDLRKPASLGLSLVKNLAEEQLSGQIKLNTLGRTEFVVRFRELSYTDRF